MNDYDFVEDAYMQHFEDLYIYSLVLTGCEYAAQDLVSETFLRVLAKIRIFKKYKNLSAALRRTALNILINKTKHKEPLSFSEFCELYYPSSVDIERIVSDAQVRTNLITAFHQLDSNNQRILLLHYFYEINFVEISKALGIKYSTLLHRHQAALRQLRYILVGDGSIDTMPDFGVNPKSRFYMFILYLLYLMRYI